MKKPQSPCRGCKARQVGCFTSCGKYASFRKELEKYNTLVFSAKQEGADALHFEIVSYKKGKKRRNSKK